MLERFFNTHTLFDEWRCSDRTFLPRRNFEEVHKNIKAEKLIAQAMQHFISHQKRYGTTAIDWWFHTYNNIPERLQNRNKGFDVISLYAQIDALAMGYSIVEEASQVQYIVKDARHEVGNDHPLIAELQEWADDWVDDESGKSINHR